MTPSEAPPSRPLATALLFLGHLGLSGLWIALSARGDTGPWLVAAVLQAAVGISLGLLELKRARPMSLILMPPALVWLAGLTVGAVSVAGLARHLPHVHPLAVTSAWYAGLGRIDLSLSYAEGLAAFGFLAAMTTFAAAARAARGRLNFVVVLALLLGLGGAFAIKGTLPALDLGSFALFGGLALAVLVGDAPVAQRLGAGLAWVAAVYCAAEVERLWAQGSLLAILEAERDAGALGVGGGLTRLAALEDAAARGLGLTVAAGLGALTMVGWPRAADGQELWRRPLVVVGAVGLALPIGVAAKADRDARGAGIARALQGEAQTFDPAAPVGGNRDRVEVAPVLQLRGDKVALMGDEMPAQVLDAKDLLAEGITAARAALYEKLHEDLPTRAGWRPPPDRPTVVLAVSARAPAAELMRALRGLSAAGFEEAQVLLRREPPDPAHPLSQLPLAGGIQAGLDVPRVLPVRLRAEAPTARLDLHGLHAGERSLPRADLGAAMRVAELIGTAKQEDGLILGIEAEGVSTEDVVRALDPARAVLQLPVAVSVATP